MTLYVREKSSNALLSSLLTGEDLARQDGLGRGELLKGVFIKMPPPGAEHGRIESRIGAYLLNFVEAHDLGEVFVGETGIYTSRNPDTVRGMDVAYISFERLKHNQSPTYIDVAPELIVEVLSPHNRWSDIYNKVAEYFDIGTDMVWIVDPQRHELFVYRSLDDILRLTKSGTVTGQDVLPGFELSLAKLFRTRRG